MLRANSNAIARGKFNLSELQPVHPIVLGSFVQQRLQPEDASLRVPHVGWNDLSQTRPDCVLFDGIDDGVDSVGCDDAA